MCWLWFAFISLGGYGKVSFVSGSAIVSHAFASCTGQPLLFWLRCAAHDASRESCVCLASGALFRLFCPRVLGFHRSSWPNMALKGTCRLMAVLKFYNLSSFGVSFNVRERHAP